jgi:hypothetical protein
MRIEKSKFRQLQHQLVERIAVWGDRYLYKPHIEWIVNQAWLDPYRPYMINDPALRRPHVRKLDRRFALIEFARFTRTLTGSTAECGIARGVGSALICKALEGTYGPTDHHYGFDAFSGLPEPAEVDAMASGAKGWEAGDLKHDGTLARAAIAQFPEAEVRVGWIPETFAGLEDERFRFVHIDVDLYQATHDSIEFFFPRLVTGGVILLDDHGFTTCPGARKAAQEYFVGSGEVVVDLPTGQGLVIKRQSS